MKLIFFLIIVFGSLPNLAIAMHKECRQENCVVLSILDYSKKIKKEKNVELTMYGVNYAGDDKVYDGKVHLIDLGFRIDEKMKYDEARKFFYSIVDGFIEHINQDESVRNMLFHYPVTYKDLYFRLSFDYEDEGYLNIGDISMIAILENKIKYFILEEDGRKARMEMRKINPDVYCGTGFSPKTRCVTKKLPEEVSND